ncbi:hypothetical protein KIN20_038330 [Parelaphostrongylus tenuis]|uniref:Uncharacterized protein n=1 Tax=Parelaphostrongylus tenuis TaxID=148309 RepID=A0AAD5RF64_PARTN|nr:hypothetical protein KIN20_038330 [Parelaphostrongylus tenuis]
MKQLIEGGVSESSDVETEADEVGTSPSSANDNAVNLSRENFISSGFLGKGGTWVPPCLSVKPVFEALIPKKFKRSSENPEEDADPGVDSSSGNLIDMQNFESQAGVERVSHHFLGHMPILALPWFLFCYHSLCDTRYRFCHQPSINGFALASAYWH